jgi:hypothetical protein
MNFFATCEVCGKHSELYGAFLNCTECMATVCESCTESGTLDEENGRCTCKECAAIEKEARMLAGEWWNGAKLADLPLERQNEAYEQAEFNLRIGRAK